MKRYPEKVLFSLRSVHPPSCPNSPTPPIPMCFIPIPHVSSRVPWVHTSIACCLDCSIACFFHFRRHCRSFYIMSILMRCLVLFSNCIIFLCIHRPLFLFVFKQSAIDEQLGDFSIFYCCKQCSNDYCYTYVIRWFLDLLINAWILII